LWQGRFFSCPVEPQNTPIVARYIELNPVRAKICGTPRQYPWSSADIACSGGADGRSGFAPIYSPSGTWEDFLTHQNEGETRNQLDELKNIRRTISSGKPFGSDEFLRKIERQTGIIVTNKTPGRRAQPEALNDDQII
jgi:putative transposase